MAVITSQFLSLIIIQQMWNHLIIQQLSDEIANHTTEITDWIKTHEVETEEVLELGTLESDTQT